MSEVASAAQLPLFAWGDALRAARARRARRVRHGLAIAGGTMLLLLTAAVPPRPWLVWNVSASMPIGLYAVTPATMIEPGDIVIAMVPGRYRRLAGMRGYVPATVPLVKRVAATAGDQICARGALILVEERPVAKRHAVDAHGRVLPSWWGCRRLHGHQLLLLAPSPDSFDGRYFGVTSGTDVVGRAWPLWVR